MNYNPNAGIRNPQGPRKLKRVSDLNAVGPSAPMPEFPTYMQQPSGSNMMDPMANTGNAAGVGMNVNPTGMYSGASMPQQMSIGGFNATVGGVSGEPVGMEAIPNQNYGYMQPPASQPNTFTPMSGGAPPLQPHFTSTPAPAPGMAPVGAPGQFGGNIPPQLQMFQQPIVQDMAMQYGQRLADHGKQLVESHIEKWVPVSRLRYYFSVDNRYVLKKMRLLFFPFTHKDWSLKYDQENPVQPRFDVNAPDLYIPCMAFITYVVMAGLMLGMQQRFTPEQLGIQASSALAYCIFELVIYSITLYVVNIKTSLRTLDLLAFSGYKFVTICFCLAASTLFYGEGYYGALLYSSLTLGFFLLRTLKTKVLNETTSASSGGAIHYDPYGNPQQFDYTGGRKRKLYFLFLVVGGQAIFSFLLSKHLYYAPPKV